MFTALDWIIIAAYLAGALAAGAFMTRRASRGLESYFLAGRHLPWWWLGTSMAATTFASDTPLAVTGIVARDGIAGNWFLWCSVLTYMTMTVFFADRWRAARVLTDVEFVELRYGGRPAGLLRGVKALYLSVIVNGVVLGWVFRAMSKISRPFISWEALLGPDMFARLAGRWPRALVFDTLENTLTVLVILLIVVTYSSMGGIRGVILTDLFQFALALGCSFAFAWYALAHTGGISGLLTSLRDLYPERAAGLLRVVPATHSALMPLQVLAVYLGLLWWAQYFSDGSGYLAQRLNTARTPADAARGSYWFTLACFVLRTWPWVIVALAALVVFPLDDPTRFTALGADMQGDREMAYPLMMKLVLPPGLLGLMFVSLLAAFMSTVDTHINWAASYLVNDVYGRFLRPRASQRELVRAGRCCVVLIALLAVLIAGQISSIERAWKFFIAIGAGLGLPQLLRWVWWRANVWTEIAGMGAALGAALCCYSLWPGARDEYLLCLIVPLSTAACIGATLLTRPATEPVLQRFARRVRPFGVWRDLVPPGHSRCELGRRTRLWLLGTASVYALLFGPGMALFGRVPAGILLSAAGAVAAVALWRALAHQPAT